MFQFAFPSELLQFRLNGPEFVPLFTLAPEMTTDRAFLYPHIFTSYLYFFFAADIIVGFRISKGRELPACMCYGSFAGSSGGYKSPGPP